MKINPVLAAAVGSLVLLSGCNKKEAQDIPLPPDPRIGMVIFDDEQRAHSS